MPGKTKNRRNRIRRNRKGSQRQRGGDWLHTLSFGVAGTADDSTTSSDSGWFGQKWWDSLTSSNKPTIIDTNTNTIPIQQSYTPDTSSLSNSEFGPNDTTYNPMLTNEYNKNGYNGGKKSKSRSCHRKRRHKHTKSCKK